MNVQEKQTEERIFESATKVFIEKGLEGTRMQDIANHAGINRALLHYYYRTKDKLFDVVFEKTAEKIFMRFAPILDGKLTLEEKIRFFYKEHISFLQSNPKLPAFLLNEINRNPGRIKKMIQMINIEELWNTLEKQHKNEFSEYNISRDIFAQLLTSIAALSLFPFAARGIFEAIFEKTGIEFNKYIEQRKSYAADFVIKAIKR
jgi:AcrR family transcriptional regulator